MGLNDDVDEGLEPYVTPLDENPDQADAPKVNLVNKTTSSVESDDDINTIPTRKLFGTPIVPNELPNLDAEFTVVLDEVNKVQDMSSVRAAVATSCGICQEDINNFNAVDPGFINNGRPIGFYTEGKSKTQFSQALSSMDASIEVAIENLKMQAIACNEKIIPVYSKMAKAMEEALTKNQTKAHLLYSELVLLRAGPADEGVLKYLKELDTRIPYSQMDNENIPQSLQPLLKLVCIADNRANIVNLVRAARASVQQHIQVHGELYGFSDEEPFLVIPEGEDVGSFDRSSSFLDYLYSGIDMVSIAYLQRLCQVSVNLTSAMATSSNLLTELAQKPTANLKERLDIVTRIVAINQKYARQNAYLLSFMHDYLEIYDSLIQTALDLKASAPTQPA